MKRNPLFLSQPSKYLFCLTLLSALWQVSCQYSEEKPNLVVVYTDEHNFRTIGAYRDLLGKKYGELWGDGVVVDTPNIDRLAHEGAIFSSMYTVAPLCTPSRASFMTGLYPKATGAHLNHNAMYSSMTTWAEILKDKRGYYTGYVGKWHLNGDDKPGWESERKFGFIETKWQYNRGHWKFFENSSTGPKAYEWTDESVAKFKNTMEKNYATDFLMDRGLEIIDRAVDKNKPFAVMVSIPDPHSPNIVRPPYDTMHDHLEFKVPFTAKTAFKKEPALPGWQALKLDISRAAQTVEEMEMDRQRHKYYSYIYGMVKLIDDNVGKLLNHLEAKGLTDNTIVVFTSDHGDQLGEHAKHNKGRPYETSAGVPMLLRWPNGVSAGKVINTAYSSIDFAPTILRMMGIRWPGVTFHGIDGSDEIMEAGNGYGDHSKTQTRFITDSAQSKWATAVRDDYKLTLSRGEPWLFDLSRDPHEIFNFYGKSNYTAIATEMRSELYDTMFQHKFPLTEQDAIYWDKPSCWDSRDQISAWKKRLCSELSDPRYSPGCQWRHIYEQCPNVCSRCCEDSPGKLIIHGELMTCKTVGEKNKCGNVKVQNFCPFTCGACAGQDGVQLGVLSVHNEPDDETLPGLIEDDDENRRM